MTLEEKLNTIQKCLTGKDELILRLETRLNNLESYEENNKKINMLQEKVSILESMTTQKAPETFKCTKCQFETNSEKGLKTHLTRKHTIISTTGYPKICELCEKKFNNSNDFKKHMKTHSYKEARFKCEDCDFVGKCLETMEIHLGKSHTDTFECGLCENDLGNLENLSLHLHTNMQDL